VLDTDGYAAASIERIAKAAAASKSTVLYHYKTKEAVALAVRALVDAASFHFTGHPGLDVEHYIAEAARLFEKGTTP
jgi:AcrR family transcriptional regulator